jgi:hypothetical protein
MARLFSAGCWRGFLRPGSGSEEITNITCGRRDIIATFSSVPAHDQNSQPGSCPFWLQISMPGPWRIAGVCWHASTVCWRMPRRYAAYRRPVQLHERSGRLR